MSQWHLRYLHRQNLPRDKIRMSDLNNYQFRQSKIPSALEGLKSKWRESLLAQQDGMWEALTDMSQHLEIVNDKEIIGYAAIDENSWLLQFYLHDFWQKEGQVVLQELIKQFNVEKALAGTHNPIFLTPCLQIQKGLSVHTLLFENKLQTETDDSFGMLKMAEKEDLTPLIEFCHLSMGGPKEWLSQYLGNLIERSEVYFLEIDHEVIGSCEVRISSSEPSFADLGMIVSSTHRKKGLGTWLLGKAKSMAVTQGKRPICSCEVDNVASLKAIHANGFRSTHQMLLIDL